ncbi:hypothetical protein Gotri_023528, partial [Gossypium trilobum]|nr:hypothetical protein [Gossypium trilobum]
MAFGDGKHDSNGHFVYISHLYYKDKNLEPTYLIATEICLSSFDRSSGAADVPLSPCNGHPYQKCVSAPFVSSKSYTKHLGNADAAVWPLYSLPSLRHQIDPLALWCIIFNRKGQKPNSLPCMNDVLATMICIDNSEWMRNGDYGPSRFQAQADAVNLICGAKTQ